MLKAPSIQAKDTFALVSPVCSIPARAFLSCGTSPYYNRSLYHRGGHKPYTQALNPYHRDYGCNRPLCCFSKIIPSFFIDKASCTRQFESELSLHSLALLFPIKEGIFLPLRLSCKESSTSNQAFLLRRKDVTALLGARNRYAIRLADQSGLRHVVRDGTALL